MKRKLLLSLAPLLLLLFAIPAYAYGPFHDDNVNTFEEGIPLSVRVDGEYAPTDVAPFIENGRTYLPIRAASEAMGANVAWDGPSRLITITKDSTVITWVVGQNKFYVNGIMHYSDVVPKIVHQRTMLPIRPIVDALHCEITWEGTTASVEIFTGEGMMALPPQLDDYLPHQVCWLVKKYYVHDNDADSGTWGITYTNERGYTEGHYLMTSKMKGGTPVATKIDFSFDPSTGAVYDLGVSICPIYSQTRGFLVKDTLDYCYWYGQTPPFSMSGHNMESYICGDSYPDVLDFVSVTSYSTAFPDAQGILIPKDLQLQSLNTFPVM